MTITESLAAEHRTLFALFDQIDRVLPRVETTSELKTLATVVEGLLQTHAEAETELAYLPLDHILAEKGQLDRLHHDHHELDDRFERIQAAESCAEAQRLMQSAIRASREHLRGEERMLFPVLEKHLSRERLQDLGRCWLERKD